MISPGFLELQLDDERNQMLRFNIKTFITPELRAELARSDFDACSILRNLMVRIFGNNKMLQIVYIHCCTPYGHVYKVYLLKDVEYVFSIEAMPTRFTGIHTTKKAEAKRRSAAIALASMADTADRTLKELDFPYGQ